VLHTFVCLSSLPSRNPQACVPHHTKLIALPQVDSLKNSTFSLSKYPTPPTSASAPLPPPPDLILIVAAGMATAQPTNTQPGSLKRRLLHDIAEIQQDPYPNVHLYFDDANIHKACLVLTPDGEKPLHLRINFWDDYPLRAPEVTIQSRIVHPNVFDSYICATILNTREGWTSAYTLKGIVIQLLSFFSSDSLEQNHGGGAVKLAEYRKKVAQRSSYRVAEFHGPVSDTYYCPTCGFGRGGIPSLPIQMKVKPAALVSASTGPTATEGSNVARPPAALFSLPDEIVLQVFTELPTRDVLAFADAVPSIGKMLNSYDFIRIRELQCFCLKRSFMDTKLGIGVSIEGGRRLVFRSEFDLLSEEAFLAHGVRNSIQGVRFDKWLPLPLSRRHWNQVKSAIPTYLQDIHTFAKMPKHEPGYVDVLYNFMNTIVVQFSADEEKRHNRPDARSTLSHISEKAVEAYFSLFHLMLSALQPKIPPSSPAWNVSSTA
jgi:ubiquitin-protein ligase